ncbi:hypothetical protein GCM10018791_32710 [Streptomyces zaomyceticus]|nr:hypothetical protein GCM10018791_32710 [Streptomyces zaomyceticus]
MGRGSVELTVQVATILAGHVRAHIGFTEWIRSVDVCFRHVRRRSAIRRGPVPSVGGTRRQVRDMTQEDTS